MGPHMLLSDWLHFIFRIFSYILNYLQPKFFFNFFFSPKFIKKILYKQRLGSFDLDTEKLSTSFSLISLFSLLKTLVCTSQYHFSDMDPNNNPFNTQNPNDPFNYQNPNNYRFPPNQSSNQGPQNIPNYVFPPNQSSNQGPQNIPNYVFPPNFIMPAWNPNYRPYYGSMMQYSYEANPSSSSIYGNENAPNVGLDEFPECSTQIVLGGMRCCLHLRIMCVLDL